MKVIIIGGGIAGLTTAIALRQHGIQAQVFEAARRFAPVGKGIWVSPNAMRVLQRWGLAQQVEEAGIPLERIEIIDRKDGLIRAMDLRSIRDRLGHTTVSIHRAALHRILRSKLPQKTLRLGKTCQGLKIYDDAVVAHFKEGGKATGDLLVGADGIRSYIRHAVDPFSELRYSGQSCYRGIASFTLPPERLHTAQEIWDGDVRFGFSAIDANQVYWYAPFVAPPRQAAPAEGLTEALLARYAAFPDPVRELIRHTPPESIIRTDLFDLKPLKRWWVDRIVLVGDAAHAMTPNLGQGAAQAMEDAWVLAEALAQNKKDIPRALETYERRRRERVERVVKQSWLMGRAAHIRHPALRWLRNRYLRRIPEKRLEQDMLWLYQGIFAA